MIMVNTQQINARLERQQLIEQCHNLIAEIANHPNALKLLRSTIKMLESYAAYKANRRPIRTK
jgi:ribose 1,5-bisphosphokinase PhnN